MRSFATGGASRATGGRPGDDDGHDPFGDCTSSGWEGTEGADADADAAGGSTARTHATTHDDGWEANFEDLMAMEDSYGSGVEDLSTAAMDHDFIGRRDHARRRPTGGTVRAGRVEHGDHVPAARQFPGDRQANDAATDNGDTGTAALC